MKMVLINEFGQIDTNGKIRCWLSGSYRRDYLTNFGNYILEVEKTEPKIPLSNICSSVHYDELPNQPQDTTH